MGAGCLDHNEGSDPQSSPAGHRAVCRHSEFIQGHLIQRNRGLAGVFLTPFLAEAGAKFRTWWGKGAFRADRPAQEGQGVGWLRNWAGSLTVAGGSAVRLS